MQLLKIIMGLEFEDGNQTDITNLFFISKTFGLVIWGYIYYLKIENRNGLCMGDDIFWKEIFPFVIWEMAMSWFALPMNK